MTEGMTIDPEQDTTSGPDAIGLGKVIGLATALSEELLDAQIMRRSISDEHVRVLAKAAILLEEHSVELPPLLLQVLHDIERSRSGPDASSDTAESTMARLMRPFRRRGT